jgi:DNA-binding response OmpR family regulator
MRMIMSKILLVEDDFSLGQSIEEALTREGFDVTLAKNLAEARTKNPLDYNIMLMDWMLPDGQGLDLLKEFRGQDVKVPIIMLTARTDLIDKVLGLESGANDYITKPFELRELVARIRVQLRDNTPGQTEESDSKLVAGELQMDTSERSCSFKGNEIPLTKMEFDLLHLLASSPKQTFSREKLLDKVWGLENYPTTRTVDTHVLQLRQKLDSNIIETVRGVGYRFAAK